MPTLYDFELSGSCYKIRLLLNILGVEYSKHNVDFVNKEHKNAEYLKLNPFGEIPIYEEGTFACATRRPSWSTSPASTILHGPGGRPIRQRRPASHSGFRPAATRS